MKKFKLQHFIYVLLCIPSFIIIGIIIMMGGSLPENSTNTNTSVANQYNTQRDKIQININLNKIGTYKDEIENIIYFYDKELNELMKTTDFWIFKSQYVFAPYLKMDMKTLQLSMKCFIYEHETNESLSLFDKIIWNVDNNISEYELKRLYPADVFRYAKQEGKCFDCPLDLLYKIANSNKTTYRLKGYSNYDKEITVEEISALQNILQCYKDIEQSFANQ